MSQAEWTDVEFARAERAAASAEREAAAILLYRVELAREAAAADRDLAALSRHQAALERTAAYTDQLTGAWGKADGMLAIDREIDRSRRLGSDLVVGFVRVMGLGLVNETEGRLAGDYLLQNLMSGLQASLRSYDVLFRFGGDEFVFSMAGADIRVAATRFAKMQGAFGRARNDKVRGGFAELKDGDTSELLIERAAADLTAIRV
jgi:diguanylate cyclase (GGDEF)-like protein